MKSRLLGASCACLLSLVSLPASSATIELGAIDAGQYRSDGWHSSPINNYLAGESSKSEYEHRNWFSFDLSSVTLEAGELITGATLSLQNGGYGGGEKEEWTVMSVETDVTVVMADHGPGSPDGIAIFADLKDESIYGSTTISLSTPKDAIIDVGLTGVAISNITSSIGGLFAVGGYVSSLNSPLLDEFLFSGTSNQLGTVNLLLETTAVPIPPAIWLFGSGLLGLIGISRRKKA